MTQSITIPLYNYFKGTNLLPTSFAGSYTTRSILGKLTQLRVFSLRTTHSHGISSMDSNKVVGFESQRIYVMFLGV